MNEEFKKELINWGMDWDDVSGRFMDREDMILKYTKRVPADPSFNELTAAVAGENPQAAFAAVHNMKGVCSNLGLKPLLEPVSALTEELRGGEFHTEAVTPLFDKISERYEALTNIISRYS